MTDYVGLLAPVLATALIAQASPGPATLAITREAVLLGRKSGIALALGVTTGSWTWSAVAAGGMSALILANPWTLIGVRLAAALYLGWLAFQSARAAFTAHNGCTEIVGRGINRSYFRGLLIHLANPKPILFFASLYALGIPAVAPTGVIPMIAFALAFQSLVIFVGLAMLLSDTRIASRYLRHRRIFDSMFAIVFAAASLGLLRDAILSMLLTKPK